MFIKQKPQILQRKEKKKLIKTFEHMVSFLERRLVNYVFKGALPAVPHYLVVLYSSSEGRLLWILLSVSEEAPHPLLVATEQY